MTMVEVGTARLAVSDAGTGPSVVAMHAAVADSRVWGDCVPAWTAAGRRVVTWDRRGFGRSTWQAEEFDQVDDLVAVMDALVVPDAVLVANSDAGRIALEAALRHPRRVRGLVLVAPNVTGNPWTWDDYDPQEVALDSAAGAAQDDGDLDLADRLAAHLWLDGPRQAEGRVTGPARELFLDMNGRALAAPPVGTERPAAPQWPRLASLSCPVGVVVGDLDVAPHLFGQLADAITGASLTTIPGSAHLPMLDAPGAFLAAVEPFLAATLH